MPESSKYHESVIVTQEHLDQLNHVNNVVYLHWVQQVAEHHWGAVSSKAIQDQYLWVVLSHYIEYKKPAMLGDELTLETYVEGFEGVKSKRRVNIKKRDMLIATALTEWCMLDADTRRPRRETKKFQNPIFYEVFKETIEDRYHHSIGIGGIISYCQSLSW